MKILSIVPTLISVACLGAGGLLAQQGFEAKLRSTSEFLMSGKTADLILTLTIKEKTKVPATLLNGIALKTTIDGKPGPKIVERATGGNVTLVGGTKVERLISLDLGRIMPSLKKNGVTRVSFEWVGLPGVSAIVNIAPDLKGVNIDDLDLRHTKVLLVTNYGDMLLKFYADKAPNHARNFIKLAKDGFYDGTRFHRVIKGFMLQGGCPNTKKGATGQPGTGGPGYKINAEFNDTRHVKGVLSMARGGDPNSAGCQFFVVHRVSPHLDGSYTAFGELVTGHDTLDKIAAVAVGGPSNSTPIKPVHLKAAIVQPHFKTKKK
jgi:peptidyl-prolyl cis-trans isomerase B (cyclophilin B)